MSDSQSPFSTPSPPGTPELPVSAWISGELSDVTHHASEVLYQVDGLAGWAGPDTTMYLDPVGHPGHAKRGIRLGDEITAIRAVTARLPVLANALPARANEELFEAVFGIGQALLMVTGEIESADKYRDTMPGHLRGLHTVLDLIAETRVYP